MRTWLTAIAATLIAAAAPAAAAAQPALQLPWPKGQSWIYVGGPHNTNGCANGGFTCVNPRPWNSLDFSSHGAGTVTAAAAGRVESTNACPRNSNFVIVDHGGGWHTTYYHLTDIKVHPGEQVAAGQPLGTISSKHGCGGHAVGPHVHFSVAHYSGGYTWHKGQLDLNGFRIGGWVFHDGRTQYAGCATNVATHQRVCPGGKLSNNGATASQCGDTNVMTSVMGIGVACPQALQVANTWANQQPGCGPNGQTCEVLGFSCVVPATDNSTHLECTAGDTEVTGVLRPY